MTLSSGMRKLTLATTGAGIASMSSSDTRADVPIRGPPTMEEIDEATGSFVLLFSEQKQLVSSRDRKEDERVVLGKVVYQQHIDKASAIARDPEVTAMLYKKWGSLEDTTATGELLTNISTNAKDDDKGVLPRLWAWITSFPLWSPVDNEIEDGGESDMIHWVFSAVSVIFLIAMIRRGP